MFKFTMTVPDGKVIRRFADRWARPGPRKGRRCPALQFRHRRLHQGAARNNSFELTNDKTPATPALFTFNKNMKTSIGDWL